VKFVFYTNSVSPHQLPLAREIVKRLGGDSYRYVATGRLPNSRIDCGWREVPEPWIVYGRNGDRNNIGELLKNALVVMSGIRDLELFEERAKRGLLTIYSGERWFKPILGFSGKLRMLSPRYRQMVKRFADLTKRYECIRVLPIGVHAWSDFEQIGVPRAKMTMWGYFVEPGSRNTCRRNGALDSAEGCKKILWVGRMVRLKHVDSIIRSVARLRNEGVNMRLTLVGGGAEKIRLARLARKIVRPEEAISFHNSVSVSKVRGLMRAHDIFVFASDARDGWGAVVNEAMEEGMAVVGTYETGAAATILPDSNLFHSGNVNELVDALRDGPKYVEIGDWAVERAAERLLSMCHI